jgi:hypothetical protein
MVIGCFSTPLCYKCLTISINKSHKWFFCCHSSTPLALTDSLSLNTYCFRLLTVGGNNNYYINWHIVNFRQFKCCCGIRTNMFTSKHVLYLNIFGAFSLSMFYIKANYSRIMIKYFSWFNMLGFNSCYRFRGLNYSDWHKWYLSFPIMTSFHWMTSFTIIGTC